MMQGLRYFRYQLQLKKSVGVMAPAATHRQGMLVSYGQGFADLFPWPEFNDANIDQQIEWLRAGRPSALAQRSLRLAEIDGQWRARQENPLRQYPPLRNHLLMTDLNQDIQATKFQTIKIKMARNYRAMLTPLEKLAATGVKIRLDFNSSLELPEFLQFVNELSSGLKQQIEFIEDPMPYDKTAWQQAREHLPLACDFEFEKIKDDNSEWPFSVLVLKPARQDLPVILERVGGRDLSLVITSSLDHPVGCIHALAQALELKKNSRFNILDAGCMSWQAYLPTDFSQHIETRDNIIVGTQGYGIGFDQLFERLPWVKI